MIFLKFIMEDTVTKKVVISGYYGFKNFGDEAILSVLLDFLKKNDSDIVVFSSNPEWTNLNYSVNSVYSFDYKAIFKNIKNSDILISGGGSLLQDVTSLKSLVYYCLIIFLGVVMRKKVVIFAQGIGPIKNPIARFVTLQLLRFASYISVRDEGSYNFLKKHKINSSLVCDPIYSVNVPQKVIKRNVGIQLRNFNTMSIDFINHLAMQIAKNFPYSNLKLLSLQDSIDLPVLSQLEHALHVIAPDINIEILSELTNSEIVDYIAGLEYFVAMRFHAILIALKSGVKTIAVNYDPKVAKLAVKNKIPMLALDDFSGFDEAFDDLKRENPTDILKCSSDIQFNWDDLAKLFI